MNQKRYSFRPRMVVHVFSEDGTRKIGECPVLLDQDEYKLGLGDLLTLPAMELTVNEIIEKATLSD